MILYHGTTLSRGEGIIKDHCIKHDISRVYTNTGKLDCDTTNGYVYLTPNIETAYFYGNLNSLRSEKKMIQNMFIYLKWKSVRINYCQIMMS